MAHHFTSFMLVFFILLHYTIVKVREIPYLRRHYFGPSVGYYARASFLLLASVAVVAYWEYIAEILHPHAALFDFIQSLFHTGSLSEISYSDIAGISPVGSTLRSNIIFWGINSSLMFFAALLMYGIIPKIRSLRVEALSFTLYLFICGVVALLLLYVLPFGIGIFPDRLFVFGWLFGFAPLLFVILQGNRFVKRISIIILSIFCLLNIYSIDDTSWDLQSTTLPSATTEEDYYLAQTIDFSEDTAGFNSYALFAVYDVQNRRGKMIDFSSTADLLEYEWVVVQKESLSRSQRYLPTQETAIKIGQLLQGQSTSWVRIYESKDLAVLKKLPK